MSYTPRTPMSGSFRHAHLQTGGTDEEKFDSSYFVPNYPFKDPVFYIPRVPNIVKVPEPAQPKRQPPAGYDMRTLRKQLEFLTGEIEEREDTQNLLYTQNEQLWNYIQELMEANKANAQLMRGEVLKLHTELKNAHRERFDVAEKLQLARNSKQMLSELNTELQGAQLTVEEIERRKIDAENALIYAKEENSHLEEVLRSQQEEILGAHNELDSYRKRQLEEKALDLADDFFYTNKAVLRAAYYRFRSGVQKRFKLSKVTAAVKNVYGSQLKGLYFRNWCKYVHRCQVMHLNVSRRRIEYLQKCLQQWKVYAALEKYFKQSHKRVLLRRVFRAWRSEARESAYENWALIATKELHTLQFKRKFFQAWRRGTMFLYWNNPMVRLWEQDAETHYLRRVLRGWRRVATSSKHDLQDKAEQVPRVVQFWHLRIWRELCESRWRRRGKLMRRFFKSIKRGVAARAEHAVTRKYAYSFYVSFRQRQALKSWVSFLRARRMFITGYVRSRGVAGVTNGGGGASVYGSGVYGARSGSFDQTYSSNVFADTSRSAGLFLDTFRPETEFDAFSPRPATSPIHLTGDYNATPRANAYSDPNTGLSANNTGMSYFTHVHSTSALPQVSTKMANHRRGRSYNRWQQHKTLQVLSHMKRRWLRSSFLVLTYISKVLHTQHLNLQSGMQHYISNLAYKSLDVWRNNVRRDVNRRRKKRFNSLTTIIDAWKAFTADSLALRKREEGIAALQARASVNRQRNTFRRWSEETNKITRLHRCSQYLHTHLHHRHLRKHFATWRGKWSTAVFWQVKELQVECSRTKSINELNALALTDLESQYKRSVEFTATLQARVVALQNAVADANNLSRAQSEEIVLREAEKLSVLHALQNTQSELHGVVKEQEQMRVFENILIGELQAQEEERAILKHTAAEVMARVASESDLLRSEVAVAREQSMHAERQAQSEIQRRQAEVEAVQREAEDLQYKLLQKRERLRGLEGDQSVLADGLSRVQHKLGEVSRDGAALIAENEALIRSRGSSVRVLRSNAGLAEARVAALQGVISDFEQERGRMQLNEVLEGDTNELNELIALQRQFESSMHHSLRGTQNPTTSSSTAAVLSSSPATKAVSLFHNVLSPAPAVGHSHTPVLNSRGPVAHGPGRTRTPSPQRVITTQAAVPVVPVTTQAAHAVHSTLHARSGGPGKRSIRTDASKSEPSKPDQHKIERAKSEHAHLPSHRGAPPSIGAPTPPTLTPHNNQPSSRTPTHAQLAHREALSASALHTASYSAQVGKISSGLSRGALDESIFDLVHPAHNQSTPAHVAPAVNATASAVAKSGATVSSNVSRGPMLSLSHATNASPLSAPLSSAVPPPPRAHSPPRLTQPQLGALSTGHTQPHVSSSHATHSHVWPPPAPPVQRQLHLSPPQVSSVGSFVRYPKSTASSEASSFSPPQSPFKVSQGFPRSPPTFLTAALDTDSESEGGPPHGGSARLEVDILSRYEARQRTEGELSLGSGQHDDRYYDDAGEGSEESDGENNANEFIYHEDFRRDASGSEGSY